VRAFRLNIGAGGECRQVMAQGVAGGHLEEDVLTTPVMRDRLRDETVENRPRHPRGHRRPEPRDRRAVADRLMPSTRAASPKGLPTGSIGRGAE
jgi:hypothetical protein